MKQNKTNESGRSMVEMLGVLAVIGVLSVGGITAYRTAMSQYKANELWNDIMLRAQVIRGIPDYRSCSSDVAADEVEFASLGTVGNAGYEITGHINENGELQTSQHGVFYLVAKDVPTEVCEKVLKMRPNDVVAVWPNNEWGTTCGASKTMRFIFDFPAISCTNCQSRYEAWKENCGTTWRNCIPDLGFFCNWVTDAHARPDEPQCAGYFHKTTTQNWNAYLS